LTRLLSTLRRGVLLDEGMAHLRALRLISRSPGGARLRLVLETGWKRQVRRMCAGVGLQVVRLQRGRIGTLRLGPLAPGAWRELTGREIRDLIAPGRPARTARSVRPVHADRSRRSTGSGR